MKTVMLNTLKYEKSHAEILWNMKKVMLNTLEYENVMLNTLEYENSHIK